jgi:hypothetical protein
MSFENSNAENFICDYPQCGRRFKQREGLRKHFIFQARNSIVVSMVVIKVLLKTVILKNMN